MATYSAPIALERGLLVIELLVTLPGGVGFGEIARHLGISNTSTMRLLGGMVAAKYVAKGSDGLYRCGLRARRLGQPADLHERLLRLGRGFLERLVRETGQTAITVYHSGEFLVCVDRVLVASASPLQEPGHLVTDLRAAPWGWWFRSPVAWQATPDIALRRGSRQADNATIVSALQAAAPMGAVVHDSTDRRRLAAPVQVGDRIVACLGLGGTRSSLPDARLAACAERLAVAAQAFARLLARP